MPQVSNFKKEEPNCPSSSHFSTTGLIHYHSLQSDMASHGVATSYVLEDSSQMLIGNSWNIWSPVISLPSSPTVLQRGWPCSSSKKHTMPQELSTWYSFCKARSSFKKPHESLFLISFKCLVKCYQRSLLREGYLKL